MQMKKIIALLLTGCILISGCSSGTNKDENSSNLEQDSSLNVTPSPDAEENLFETEDLITVSVGDIEYSIPESWERDKRESDKGTYYYDSGLMIMMQIQDDFAHESLDTLSEEEKEIAKDSFISSFTSSFEDYEETRNDFTTVCGKDAIILTANIEQEEYTNFELILFINNYKCYVLTMTSDDLNYNVNKEMFDSLLDTIEVVNVSENSDNPYQSVVDEMKELYMDEIDDMEYTEENSAGCFEIVLKTSKELSMATSDSEELVNHDLFMPFAMAAGYLCKYYDESTEYGRVGDLAFDLIAYTVAGDAESRDEILTEFDITAAAHGWTITTLDEAPEANSDTSSESNANEIDGVEIVAEYTLSDSIGWYTRRFLIVKNNNNYTVDITTSSLAYAADGSMVSAADGYADALGAGCTSIFYEAFETDEQIDHYDTTFNVSQSEYYESVIQDLSYTQNDISGGAIFQVTNNGSEPAEFVEGYVLFFSGNQLVEYQSAYFSDDDLELKPGETISEQITAYENFDRMEFYLTGRRSVW